GGGPRAGALHVSLAENRHDVRPLRGVGGRAADDRGMGPRRGARGGHPDRQRAGQRSYCQQTAVSATQRLASSVEPQLVTVMARVVLALLQNVLHVLTRLGIRDLIEMEIGS